MDGEYCTFVNILLLIKFHLATSAKFLQQENKKIKIMENNL